MRKHECSYQRLSHWRGGAIAGGESAAAALQSVLRGAPWEAVAGASATVGVRYVSASALVGLLQATPAGCLTQAQSWQIVRQIALTHRLPATEGDAGGHGWGGEVAGGGRRVAIAAVSRASVEARAIALSRCAAQALAAPAAQQISARDRPTPVWLERRAVVAGAGGTWAQVAWGGVAWGGALIGQLVPLVGAQQRGQGGAIWTVVIGIRGARIALRRSGDTRHAGSSAGRETISGCMDSVNRRKKCVALKFWPIKINQ